MSLGFTAKGAKAFYRKGRKGRKGVLSSIDSRYLAMQFCPQDVPANFIEIPLRPSRPLR
jgi:hypothetical protein